MLVQNILVILILLATAFFAVRWLVRTLRGRGGGCGCGCQGCPHAGGQCHCSSPRLPDLDPEEEG